MLHSSNPVLSDQSLGRVLNAPGLTRTDTASVTGVMAKTGFCTILAVAAGAVGYLLTQSNPSVLWISMIVSAIVSLILFFVMMAKPTAAIVAAPVYSITQGFFLGSLSLALEAYLATRGIKVAAHDGSVTLAGRADVAYRLLLRDDYPSWLYPVKHGATTIWERWNGWTHQDGFFNPHMNSFNHYSLGSVGEWLFRHVAGIELDPETPGFREFVLRPFLGDGLDFARASYRTMHGEIVSDWKRSGDKLTWNIRVPANTSATVYIPATANSAVTESGTAAEQATGIRVVGREDNFLVCEAIAGAYFFSSICR